MWLPLANLRLHVGCVGAGHVRWIRDKKVNTGGRNRCQEIGREEMNRRFVLGAIALGNAQRVGRNVGSGDGNTGFEREADGDCAGAGADIQNACVRMIANPCQCGFDKMFGDRKSTV